MDCTHAVHMPNRLVLIASTAAVLLAGSLLSAGPALADADCSVTDVAPGQIALGIGPYANVQFQVGTDCDDSDDVNSYLTYNPNTTDPWGFPLIADFPQPVFSKYVYVAPETNYRWYRTDKQQAGYEKLRVDSYIGDPADGNGLDAYNGQVLIVHRTTFGATFNASPEPRRRGQTIKITGKLQYANWDTNAYQGFGAYVMLQFRRAGTDDYLDVKRVWDNGDSATTKVIAAQTGSWRYAYPGDGANYAASHSKGDTVVVHG